MKSIKSVGNNYHVTLTDVSDLNGLLVHDDNFTNPNNEKNEISLLSED